MSTVGNALLKKLNEAELHLLTLAWNDGGLDTIFYTELLPADTKNFPESYPRVDDLEEINKRRRRKRKT
jgi:hypothetical protein